MNILNGNLSKSARKKFYRYGKIPERLRSSAPKKIKVSHWELQHILGLNSQSMRQQHFWENLELYRDYKKKSE